MGTLIPPQQKSPALLVQYLHAQADQKFGHDNWRLLYEKAQLEMVKLTGVTLTSKRDFMIFLCAFYFGLSFAIPVAEAAAKARTLPGIVRRALEKKPKKNAEEKSK